MRAAPFLQRLERAVAVPNTWIAANAQALARRRTVRKLTLGGLARDPARLSPTIAAELLRGSGAPGFIGGLRANLEYDFRECLGEIACPTLIVWGAQDRLIPARDADTFERLIPNSRKVIFEGTGHLAMIERPALFNPLLDEFLRE
jgi:pimeloyl-ACP methyl ester carboxylesterase